MQYHAFISYSHGADGQLARALQSGLQRLAKPWFRRPIIKIFRDQTLQVALLRRRGVQGDEVPDRALIGGSSTNGLSMDDGAGDASHEKGNCDKRDGSLLGTFHF